MNNKFSDTVKFVVGCFTIYLIWQLHKAGVFFRIGSLFDFGASPYGSVTNIILGIVPVVCDAVIVVGGVALAVYGFIWRSLSPVLMKLLRLLDAKLEEYGIDLIEFENEKEGDA